MKKNRKHDKIVKDFKNTKSKHLERQATKMLKKDKQHIFLIAAFHDLIIAGITM